MDNKLIGAKFVVPILKIESSPNSLVECGTPKDISQSKSQLEELCCWPLKRKHLLDYL